MAKRFGWLSFGRKKKSAERAAPAGEDQPGTGLDALDRALTADRQGVPGPQPMSPTPSGQPSDGVALADELDLDLRQNVFGGAAASRTEAQAGDAVSPEPDAPSIRPTGSSSTARDDVAAPGQGREPVHRPLDRVSPEECGFGGCGHRGAYSEAVRYCCAPGRRCRGWSRRPAVPAAWDSASGGPTANSTGIGRGA